VADVQAGARGVREHVEAVELGLDHRADLFSAGSILFKMLTGRLPYETSPSGTGMMLAARFRAVNLDQPPRSLIDAKTDAPELSEEHMLDAVVRRALNVDAEARFGSAGEMRRALANALGKLTMPPEPSTPGVGADVWGRPAGGRDPMSSPAAVTPESLPDLPGAALEPTAARSPAAPSPRRAWRLAGGHPGGARRVDRHHRLPGAARGLSGKPVRARSP
jgi:serine/threonine protein kinase